MIERRSFMAGMATVPFAFLARTAEGDTETSHVVPEHEKWYFDLGKQAYWNVCLDLQLTLKKVWEKQIRFSEETNELDPFLTIESIGKGQLNWFPYHCKKCHVGMEEKPSGWCGDGYCHECASVMWKAQCWLGDTDVFPPRTPRKRIRDKENRPPSEDVRELLYSKGIKYREVHRRMTAWEESPYHYLPLTNEFTFQ